MDGGDEDLSHSAGDAWFLRLGFTVVSLGWQWDAAGPNALRLYAPIAQDHGKTITGLLRGDIMLPAKADVIPLGHVILGSIGGTEYPPSDPNDPRNTLSVRDSREAKRTLIPRSEWRFLKWSEGKSTSLEDVIVLNGGFQTGRIYEYIYVVSDPAVAGLGFAAGRDFAFYTKHDSNALTPATPRHRRRHLPKRSLPPRLPLPRLQRRRRRTHRPRRHPRPCRRSRPRQL